MDPLDVAALVFEGGPSRARVQELLDRALRAVHVEPTSEVYSRTSSSLVALRKDAQRLGFQGCTEIAMLELIAGKPGGWPRWVSVPRAVAYASESIRRRERPEDTT